MTGRSKFTRETQSVPQGTQLNNMFEIDRLVSAGGMGEVYKGHNIQTQDPVAIKIVLPEFAQDEMILELFRKEARILNHLHHEAIVRYYVFSIDAALGLPFLAMEFVDGPSLAERIKAGPLDTASVVTLQQNLADGLEKAHQAGVIHRDIAPDNIILPDGRVDRAKIIDFGIARSAAAGGGTLLGGQFAGKYNFVSPEQLGLFDGNVTNRSDIYSLGLVLAACALGRPLDMSGSQVAVIEKRRTVPDLTGIEPPLRDLIEAMLQPDPQDRPQSMAEVADWPTYDEPDVDFEKTRIYTTPPRSATRHPSRGVTRHPSRPPTSHPSQVPIEQRREPAQEEEERTLVRPHHPSRPPAGPASDYSRPPVAPPVPPPAEAAPEHSRPPASYPTLPPAERAPQDTPQPAAYQTQPPAEAVPAYSPPPTPSLSRPPAEAAGAHSPEPAPHPSRPPVEARREPSLPPSPPPAAARPRPAERRQERPKSKARLIASGFAAAALLTAVGGWAYVEYWTGEWYEEESRPEVADTVPVTPPADTEEEDLASTDPVEPAPPNQVEEEGIDSTEPVDPPPPNQVDEDDLDSTEPADPPQPDQAEEEDLAATEPVDPPQPTFTAADIRDHVTGYDGGSCFFVLPTSIAADRAEVIGYGNQRGPFDALQSSFRERFGFDAAIELRDVTDDQCAMVDALDKLATVGASRVDLDLSRGVVRSGSSLSGTISGLGERHLALVMLDNFGFVHNLKGYVTRDKDTATFEIQEMSTRSPMDFAPQLVLSVTSVEPLESLDLQQSAQASDILPSLLEEIGAKPDGLSSAVGYFMFGS